MENGNNPAERMAKEVVNELCFINRNDNEFEQDRLSRRFHEQKNKFVKTIIKDAIPDYTNNTNKVTDQKYYDDLEKELEYFFSHCVSDYRAKLVKEWNEAKKADYEKFISVTCKYTDIKDPMFETSTRKMLQMGKGPTRLSINYLERWEKKNKIKK